MNVGVFFFFQAEDGIRDVAVTGVQTCALPICYGGADYRSTPRTITQLDNVTAAIARGEQNRKSTRLNSSHGYISYAVFCLKKKKKQRYEAIPADRLTRADSLTVSYAHTPLTQP